MNTSHTALLDYLANVYTMVSHPKVIANSVHVSGSGTWMLPLPAIPTLQHRTVSSSLAMTGGPGSQRGPSRWTTR
eukprot:scaffold328117_cov30-Prasinocladus_malaysianus.AAC.1